MGIILATLIQKERARLAAEVEAKLDRERKEMRAEMEATLERERAQMRAEMEATLKRERAQMRAEMEATLERERAQMRTEIERTTSNAQGMVQRVLEEKQRIEAELMDVKLAVQTIANRCGFPGVMKDFSPETLMTLLERALMTTPDRLLNNCSIAVQARHH